MKRSHLTQPHDRSPRHVAGYAGRCAVTLALSVLSLIAGVHAQEQSVKPLVEAAPVPADLEPPLSATSTPAPVVPPEPLHAHPAEALAKPVTEVIRMADAGLTDAVILAYIESSPPRNPLTAAEIIALKEHDVGDKVVTLLVKEGARVGAMDAQRKQEAIARALASRRAVTGGLDPESYEYFQYYYLQPRAAAAAQRRLAPFYGPPRFSPYGAGPVGGFPHGRSRRPR